MIKADNSTETLMSWVILFIGINKTVFGLGIRNIA